VYLHHEGLRIIDCIEFDERYRIGDVCSDIAFLSMDLAGHGQVASSEWFLARYAQHSGDYDLYALVDFYESYRAWVRAKVSAILACDPGASEDVHRRAALEARRHFMLARACMRPPLAPPLLVCVGGVIGSGKSTVAEKLSAALSCAVVDSDRTRKQILAIAETQAQNDPAWTGAYSPGTTARVYGEALRRASVVLASHRPVIVDASFRSSSMRHRAREIARSRGAGFVFVECRAPVDVCRARLTSRSRGPSDGRPALLEEFVASFEPMTELASSEHVVVDTTQPVERTIDALRARLSDAS
jgi:predicted kinase